MHPNLPPLDRFPLARDHPRKADVIAETNHYLLNIWPFRTQAERDRFVDWNVTSVITKAIPDGVYEKTLQVAHVNVLFFYTDEMFESKSEDTSALLRRMVNMMRAKTESDESESALERMWRDIFRTFAATCTTPEYEQHVRLTCEFISAQDPVRHSEFLLYLEFRRVNAGGYMTFGWARYALDIYLTDQELSHPLVSKCMDLSIDLATMENDVVSYEKEMQESTSPSNLVTLILEHGADGTRFTTPFDAKMFVRKKIKQYEELLYAALSAALSDHELQKSDNARRWLAAMPYIVSGNAWWSQSTTRYNLPGKPVPRRTIHLEGAGDVIEPELTFPS
ncbi:isoprenoid synthase domain-containing protein [Mycena vulgaris]|nr:isoprenoid synthase domain-containing protein [Mycena vulgaris]